jgi:hypothetical protein
MQTDDNGVKGYGMKVLANTDSKRITGREGPDFICPLRPTTPLQRFQHYIETSDWDEQIMREEFLFNAVCLAAVILSGLAISPLLIAVLLK